ncbi:type I polyketide synthase [Dolichospermum flos-aquae]|jgi:phthiocerol/phenolphthiocerol synthesis type-I polyketide synthase D|uniref:LLM class flavin-dependent oxidoreductase n=1 Tax=Dolichospermum flos-aquae CCAP 1403/13F TaxID=315271 RepID=A0A6H2C2Y7_DOLFA|nr:type I polyketide synthase [Dolichospermum flos-aquae]QJB46195.1 LLM class flavin-dependent oxidoreductase [Dolichospermum flos-aquae CCAP 1403/13F]
MKFGLMFFASSEDALVGDKYSLVIDSARFADQHGFSSIWTPERHFTQFGSLYPNPAVLNAALARETQRIRLQAGSVVMPLHHPLEVAESWSLVDNLSNGRVGISLAPGWNPGDFATSPDKYSDRHQAVFTNLEILRKLWQGESLKVTDGKGQPTEVRIYPTPIQPQLPIWITAAGNPQTYIKAGEVGANLLTHLLDQEVETLGEKIALYRQARARNGHDPEAGIVSLMLHTFVGQDFELVREQARLPYCNYLKANIGLLKGLAQSRGHDVDISTLPERDLNDFVNFLYDRFATSRGLIGTPETCQNLLAQLDRIGVNEVACLLDFGLSKELILQQLPDLNQLREEDQGMGNRELLTGNRKQELVTSHQSVIPVESLETIRLRCQDQRNAREFYQLLQGHGLQLQATYQGIQNLWLGEREALAQIKLSGEVAFGNGFQVRAAVLDACHQVLGATLLGKILSGGMETDTQTTPEKMSLYLPTGLKSFQIYESLGTEVWSHAVLRHHQSSNSSVAAQEMIEGDIYIFNSTGNLVVKVSGLQMQSTTVAGQSTSQKQQDPNLLYELQWQPQPWVEVASTTTEPGVWLIFADQSGVSQNVIELLEAQGDTCWIINHSENSQNQPQQQIVVTPGDQTQMQQLMSQALAPGHPLCRGILHLWSLDVTPSQATTLPSLQQDQTLTVTSFLHLVQAVSQTAQAQIPPIWIVTQDVQQVGSETTPRSIAQAPIWGLGRVVATELPKVWGGLVDLDGDNTPEVSAKQLLHILQTSDREDQIVLRQGHPHILRLVKSQKTPVSPQSIQLQPEATYAITGGFGHFGLESAKWLAKKGAKSLALIGRRTPSSPVQSAIKELEKTGVQVLVVEADVSDVTGMTEAIATIQSTCPPLKGIFHIAGLSQQNLLTNITTNDMDAMLRPKVFGTWNLHQLTLDLHLDFFFSTSSMSPVFGSQGLGHYAAANYFLDIFAHYRHSLGLPALTVNVGALAGGGMALASPAGEKYTTQIGLNLTHPSDLLDVAGGFFSQADVANMVIADMDWSLFKPLYEGTTGKLLLGQIEAQNSATQAKIGQRDILWQQLETLPESERYQQVVTHLQQEVANILGYSANQPLFNPEVGFFDLGMDSLLAVAFKNKLENSLGSSLPTVLIFEHPNVISLTEYIITEVLQWESAIDDDNVQPVSQPSGLETELSQTIQELSEQTLEDLINQKLARALEDD